MELNGSIMKQSTKEFIYVILGTFAFILISGLAK
jgi:hypothetical protein